MIESLPLSISQVLATLSAGQAQVRYVDKAGSDTTGNGSFAKPFLTIQAAITSITDASSAKIYAVKVGVGTFSSAFLYEPWIFIDGVDQNTTIISNPNAQQLSANFSVAGSLDTGISNVTIGANLVLSFATVVSPGAGRFFGWNLQFANAIGFTVTGNNSANGFFLFNSHSSAASVANGNIVNVGLAIVASGSFRQMNLAASNTAAFICTARFDSIACSRPLTLTCNDIANFLSCTMMGFFTISAPLVIVGSGVIVNGGHTGFPYNIILPDVDATIVFSATLVAGAIVGLNEGINLVSISPTVARTLTVTPAGSTDNPGTRIVIKNNGTAIITLAGTIITTSGQTYIQPGGIFEAWREASFWRSTTDKLAQTGRSAYVNGVSPAIPVDIVQGTSTVEITLTNFNASVAIGVPVVLDADVVTGTRAGTGRFTVRSFTLGGVAVATDQSSFSWSVIR